MTTRKIREAKEEPRRVKQKRESDLADTATLEEVLAALRDGSPDQQVKILETHSKTLSQDRTSESACLVISLVHGRLLDSEKFLEYKRHLSFSFSEATWDDVKTLYGCDSLDSISQFKPEALYLSEPVLRRAVRQTSMVEKTVYGYADRRKEQRVQAWASAALIEIVDLFNGHIQKHPLGKVIPVLCPKTHNFVKPDVPLATNGFVESVYAFGEVCFLLIMVANSSKGKQDRAAQFMIELEALHHHNRSRKYEPKIIYGLLCTEDTCDIWTYETTTYKFSKSPANDGDVMRDLTKEVKLYLRLYAILYKGYLAAVDTIRYRTRLGPSSADEDEVTFHQGGLSFAASEAKKASAFAKTCDSTETFDQSLGKLRGSFSRLPAEYKMDDYDRECRIEAMDITSLLN